MKLKKFISLIVPVLFIIPLACMPPHSCAEDSTVEEKDSPSIKTVALPSELKDDSGEFTVGIVTLSPPEEYVIAEETDTKKKRLFKKIGYENIKDKNLTMVREVMLETIEYRYRPVGSKSDFASEEFELVELEATKAVLKKDCMEKPQEPTIEERRPLIEETAQTLQEIVIEEEAEGKEPFAKRLVTNLFLKIETKELKENEWEVILPTTKDAAANFGSVLGIVIKKIGELLDPGIATKIYFKTSLGKAALGSGGLQIESLNSKLRSNFGINDGDLIKSVNTRRLSTIQDVVGIFSSLTGSPQTFVVQLVRDEEDITLTYYIR